MSKIVSLSEAASIAIHGIVLIAKSDKQINVIQIAEATSTSKHHVAKVFQRLVKAGYLNSLRGPTGGFTLKKKPEDITFLNIYETIEGEITVTECPMEKPTCPFPSCIMENKLNEMTLEFKAFLESKQISNYL